MTSSSPTPFSLSSSPLIPSSLLPSNNTYYDGKFDNTLFVEAYQRNNKRGSIKNIRCFPTCGAEHKVRGFCGRSVLVTIRGCSELLTPNSNLISFLNFEPVKEPKFQIGDVTTLQELENNTRSKIQPMLPLIRGEPVHDAQLSPNLSSNTVVVMEFNRERRGWHYDWFSSKHSANESHHLRCSVFQKITTSPSTTKMVCVYSFTSPSFIIFSRRRRRIQISPTAPIATPIRSSANSTGNNNEKRVSYSQHRKRVAELQKLEVFTSVLNMTSSTTTTGNDNSSSHHYYSSSATNTSPCTPTDTASSSTPSTPTMNYETTTLSKMDLGVVDIHHLNCSHHHTNMKRSPQFITPNTTTTMIQIDTNKRQKLALATDEMHATHALLTMIERST
jgi:hypothetical protein